MRRLLPLMRSAVIGLALGDGGQGLGEYALLLGLIALVAIGAFTLLGSSTIAGMFNSASSI